MRWKAGKPEFPLPGPGLGPPPAAAQNGRRVQIRSGRPSGKPRFAEMIRKMDARINLSAFIGL
jgi:hypothetical protein